MKTFARILLKLLGWKYGIPAFNPPKSVICVAPHTSNYDFFIGKLYYWAIGRKAHFLAKRELFFFPLGIVLKAMGGVPVDRSRKTDVVSRIAALYQTQSSFHIAVTPEGTRKATDGWKTGFYRIALTANVPIQLAVIDYGKRFASIFELFNLTGNLEDDIAYIRSQYSSAQARKPRQFVEKKALPLKERLKPIGQKLAMHLRRVRFGKKFAPAKKRFFNRSNANNGEA